MNILYLYINGKIVLCRLNFYDRVFTETFGNLFSKRRLKTIVKNDSHKLQYLYMYVQKTVKFPKMLTFKIYLNIFEYN